MLKGCSREQMVYRHRHPHLFFAVEDLFKVKLIVVVKFFRIIFCILRFFRSFFLFGLMEIPSFLTGYSETGSLPIIS